MDPSAPRMNFDRVFQLSWDFLHSYALNTEGLFQRESDPQDMRSLVNRISENQLSSLSSLKDPHLIGSLFLWILRLLPQSLMDFEYICSRAGGRRVPFQPSAAEAPSKVIRESLSVMSPRTLRYVQSVISILSDVLQRSVINRSSSPDLVRLFSPVLCRPRQGAYMSLKHKSQLPLVEGMLSDMIQRYEEYFHDFSPVALYEEKHQNSLEGELRSLRLLSQRPSPLWEAFRRSNRVGMKRIQSIRRSMSHVKRLKVLMGSFERTFEAHIGEAPRNLDREPVKDMYRQYLFLKEMIFETVSVLIQSLYRGHRARARGLRTSASLPSVSAQSSLPSASGRRSTSTPRYSIEELQRQSLGDLLQLKKQIKESLMEFDAAFEATKGHAPSKAEKEPMRGEYLYYSDVKLVIESMQSGSNSETSLKTEKRVLQAKLRTFETEFERRHGRKIRTESDIQPMEKEYRRYKEIKRLLSD